MLQIIKMWFWYQRNSDPRSSCGTRRGINEKWQSKGYERIEDSNQDKRSGKLLRIC